jgi:hypothetical protein
MTTYYKQTRADGGSLNDSHGRVIYPPDGTPVNVPGRGAFLATSLAGPGISAGGYGPAVLDIEPLAGVTPARECDGVVTCSRVRVTRTRTWREIAERDPDPDVRREGVRALGALRDQEAVPLLRRLAEADPSPGVRREAAWALGALGDREALPLLRRLAEADPSPGVRWEALRTLRVLKDQEAMPLLRRLAEADPDPGVRREALRTLRVLRDQEALPLLRRLAEADPDPGVRREALEALRALWDRQ